MDNIKNVIFDLGGVLLDWSPEYVYKDYFESEEQKRYFYEVVCSSEWNNRLDAGRSFDEAVAERQKEFPEYAEPIAMWRDRWCDMLHCGIPGTAQVLRDLKSSGYHVFALTNWSAETFGYALSHYEFFKEFEGIVVSGEEKITKPDPRLYRILLDRYSLKPEESVFIDDRQSNVEVAVSLGIQGIVFTSAGQLREDLAKKGIRLQ